MLLGVHLGKQAHIMNIGKERITVRVSEHSESAYDSEKMNASDLQTLKNAEEITGEDNCNSIKNRNTYCDR